MSHSTALAPNPTPSTSQWQAGAERVYFDRFEDLADLKKAAKAPNTLRGYSSDWGQFQQWAVGQGIDLPRAEDLTEAVPPAIVLAYLADRRHEVTSATLGRHLAALRHFHRAARLPSPTDHPDVADVLAGIVHSHPYDKAQATPLYLEDLRAAVGQLGEGLLDQRNRALLLIGWWGALRRSELVGLDVSNLSDQPGGVLVKLRRSKTDQAGAGRSVAIHYRQDPALCPVLAVRAWMRAGGVKSGPVFRCVDRWGKVSGRRLSAQAVALVVKESARSIGLEAERFSAHSLRAGLVSEADRRRIPSAAVRAVTGHKSDAMLNSYSRPAELFEHSAGAYFEGV